MTRDTYRPGYARAPWTITTDACASTPGTDATGAPASLTYVFRFTQLDGAKAVVETTSPTCHRRQTLPALGRWRVALFARNDLGRSALAERDIRDLVVLAIGDSLTSGEGNPDEPIVYGGTRYHRTITPPVWKDRQCDRSAAAWAPPVAEALETQTTSVTFLDLACSGATVAQISTAPYRGEDPQSGDRRLQGQLDVAEHVLGPLTDAQTRAADIVLLSAGINDLDFGDFLEYCAKHPQCTTSEHAKAIWSGLDGLADSYAWLAAALSFHLKFSRVFALELECPRFRGRLSAWSALSGWAGRIVRHAKGIELQEAVRAGVPA